jgi:hypothetical protein
MENNNTQPQAFYTKMPNAIDNSNENNNLKPSENRKKKDFRGVFAILGLIFFITIALTGVFIAQKQVTQEGEEIKTVAPNAPESKPKATTDNNNYCATSFYIPKGTAICENKIAQSDFTPTEGSLEVVEEFTEPSSFNVGDQFVFSITVTATDDTDGDVTVEDVLPENLKFVDDPNNTPNIQVSENSTTGIQTVSLNLGEMTQGQTEKVEFIVEVITTTDPEVSIATNSATVVTNSNENTKSICSYSYNTTQGTAECISKELYNGDPADSASELVPASSALTRGEEYVYYITVKATNKTSNDIKVSDVIPENLEFVKALPDSEQYISNAAGENTIDANLGILEDEEVTLGFVVKVIDQPTLGEFTNSAIISQQLTEITEELNTCEVTHTIVPVGTAQCIKKEAFVDFDGNEMAAGTIVDPGQEFIYKVSVQVDDTTTGDVVLVDKLSTNLIFVDDPDNTEGVDYDSDTREVSFDFGVIESDEIKTVEFKVQVIANPAGATVYNKATITTDDDTSHVCELSLALENEEDYACNESCSSNEDCQSVNEDYVCYSSNDGDVCRLDSNLTSTSCTPTSTPTPTPAPGCNELCSTNADCSNSSHVCTTTDDGSNRCRLDNYPDSETCTVSTPQPELPETLPETGPEDWLNWLKAGLVTLGVGTALLLLL